MKKNVLALYLSEKTAQAMVIERNSSRYRLLALHEWHNTLFDYAGDDTPGMDEFVDHLSRLIAGNSSQIHRVGVALDSSLLFLNTIPIDSAAPREQVQEQIFWELSEYFPGTSRKAFISDIHTLGHGQLNEFENVLAISVRRDHIQKLHRGLKKLRLELDIVDLDHFSADTALRVNYPESMANQVALVGVKEQRLDISLLRNSEIESFSYYETKSLHQALDYISALSRSTEGLHSISVFGPDLESELLDVIKGSSATHVDALDPFRTVEVVDAVRAVSDPTRNPFRYAAAVGVALRED